MLIRNGNIIFPDPARHKIFMSENLKDLISKLLDRKASTRLGSNGDVNEVVSHPFFSDIDFDKLQRKEIKPPYMPSPEQMTLKEAELTEMKND